MNELVPVAIYALGLPAAIVGVVLILVAARREPDAAGRRTPARYVGAVCFLSVFLSLFATYAVVASLSQFIVERSNESSFDNFDVPDGFTPPGDFDGLLSSGSTRPSDDRLWRSAVQAGIFAVAAVGVFVFHRRYRNGVREGAGGADPAVVRVDRTYLYAACFLAVLVVLVAAAAGTYGVFRAIAPGVTSATGGDVERQRGIAQVISLVFLAFGALAVFRLHWSDRDERAIEPPSAFTPS